MDIVLVINAGSVDSERVEFLESERGSESICEIQFGELVQYGASISEDKFPLYEARMSDEFEGWALILNTLRLNVKNITSVNGRTLVYAYSR